MSKAFDSLSYSLTLKKLDAYGFNSSSLELIRSFFDSRLNRVKINGHTSEWRIMERGCPQGSSFGLLHLMRMKIQQQENEQEKRWLRKYNSLMQLRMRELEEGTSLRERVRNIFKKYGFTFSAVVLAVGKMIGVIVSALLKGLTSVVEGVGNGFKTLRSKIAGILPGLIGSIVGFIFKTAEYVISFLSKNAWILVIRVVMIMAERFQKNKR